MNSANFRERNIIRVSSRNWWIASCTFTRAATASKRNRAGQSEPQRERNLFQRSPSTRPSIHSLTQPAATLSHPMGKRKEGESFAVFLEIRATGFAGRSSAKPETCDCCSFSPGEKARMRAGKTPFQFCSSRARTIPPRGIELQLEFHAGCCCVRQCSEPEPSTRSTA